VEDIHPTTKQLYKQQHDERNNRTYGMAMPGHKQRPTDHQCDDQWTKYHKDDQRATQAIQNARMMNMLQVQMRRTLRQKLPSSSQTKADKDKNGSDARTAQVNDDN